MVSKKQQVNAVNDSTKTSSISWWHGWHLFHCISPMSLQDRTIFTDKQHLATDLARSPRTAPTETSRSARNVKDTCLPIVTCFTNIQRTYKNMDVHSVHNASRLYVHIWAQERGKEVNYACRCRVAQSTAKHLFSDFQTENTTHEFDMAKNHCRRDLQTEGWTHQQKTSLTKLGNKKLSSSATPSCIISQCLVSSCIILDFQTENTIREFDTWDGHHCRTPWCCKLHASHRSRRKHPQRYNEPNSLVTSATSCTNLLHTRTIQCKECFLRTLRPRLLRLTSKHHCRIDMQTEQWSSLWTYQFPHRLPHQTNQAPHVLARIH